MQRIGIRNFINRNKIVTYVYIIIKRQVDAYQLDNIRTCWDKLLPSNKKGQVAQINKSRIVSFQGYIYIEIMLRCLSTYIHCRICQLILYLNTAYKSGNLQLDTSKLTPNLHLS